MTGTLVDAVLLPIGLGLLGFVEPCSLGATLLFVKAIEGSPPAAKLRQVVVFAATRAVVIGLLGAAAVFVGRAFLGFQRGAWILLGAVYMAIGAAYVLGRADRLMRSFGPSLGRLSGPGAAAGLGVLFGLNIPACAAPLLLVLLGGAAARGAGGATAADGFASLGLFGLALSLPLVAAVLFAPARRALDRLAGLSQRLPFWAGLILAALGLWSIGFGLFVSGDVPP